MTIEQEILSAIEKYKADPNKRRMPKLEACAKNGYQEMRRARMHPKASYNEIQDDTYLGIITILDYDLSVRKCLAGIAVCTENSGTRKVLVDLALRVGINEYRFVSCDITDKGQIVCGSSEYVTPREGLIKLANSFILQEPEILSNSMLPNESKKELYDKTCT